MQVSIYVYSMQSKSCHKNRIYYRCTNLYMYIVATSSIIWKLKFTHKLLPVKISSKYMQLGVWDLVLFVSSYKNNGAIGIQNGASMSKIKTFLRRSLIQKGHVKGAKEKTRGRQWGL